jgi:hypothetical protein
MAESSMKTLGAGLLLAGSTKPTIIQSIESDINDLRDELALGQRIVTAAEHDRWKDIHEEISLDVQCSAEEIIVYLKGVIPNELFQLRDPKCKLKPTDRDTQAIKIRPPTACGGSLKINSTHLIVHNEIIQPIATGLAPMVLTGNIGCIFGEDELRTSLFYKEPKQLTPLMLNDANAGREWAPVKTYRGYGDNLIWARMNIYEDNNFDTAYDHPPTLTIKDHVHVGVELLKAPTEESYLLVRNCWAVPSFPSDVKLKLITDGCMDPSLKKEGLDFEVTDNGHSHKITFIIPVIKFVESDTVHLQCQVRACLTHTCQPACQEDKRETRILPEFNEYDEYIFNKTMIEYEEEYEETEIIYEEEPEEQEELADMSNIRAAMLKSANRFKLIEDDTGPEYKLSSIEFRIKHEPTEEPTGPFEGRLDPISLLLVTVLITSILLLFGIITMLFNRRKRLQKKHFHVDT